MLRRDGSFIPGSASGDITITAGQEYTLTLELSGTSIRVLVDDMEYETATSSTYQTNTHAGIALGSMLEVGTTYGSVDGFEVVAP